MKKKKKVSESAIENHVHKIFSADLNSRNTVFGGMIMSILDRIASIVAELHSGHVCVTASVDALHFIAPAKQGDILIFKASVNRSWTSSMEIGSKVVAIHPVTGQIIHVVSAYFTFVALDSAGKTVHVPELVPETREQKRRYEEAQIRREERIKMRERRANLRKEYEKE